MKYLLTPVVIALNASLLLSVDSIHNSSQGIATRSASSKQTKEQTIIPSPDKKLSARIISLNTSDPDASESRIEIHSARGKVLCSQSYISSDHSHGMKIWKSQWTTDSEYFIFNGSISGGHQPSHVPTFFYNRGDNKIHRLDPLVGIWVMSDFRLIADDSVSVTVSDRLPNGRIVDTLLRVIHLGDSLGRK